MQKKNYKTNVDYLYRNLKNDFETEYLQIPGIVEHQFEKRSMWYFGEHCNDHSTSYQQ